MHRFTEFLHSKCSLQANVSSLRSLLALGTGIFILLYLFQPFGISNYSGSIFLMCLGVGILSSCVQGLCSLLFLGIPRRKKGFVTNGDVLIYSVAIELAMAVSMTIYASFCFGAPLSWQLFFVFFYWTFLIWLLVTGISTLIGYNRMLHNRLEEVKVKTNEEQVGIMITLHDQNLRGEDLSLPINNLLYIEAQKNNALVCYVAGDKIERRELRTTLTALKADLPYDNIFQCHRSFLVNINNIESAKGNSNGYLLRFKACRDTIPVSRTFVPSLRKYLS